MAAPAKSSKNNPDARAQQRLVIFSPVDHKPMIIVKRVPGGFFYVGNEGDSYPVYKGSYKNFVFEWQKK